MSFSLGAQAVAEESALHGLLKNAIRIGGIFDLGYHEASILTNDRWLERARGLPQHCLLLAYPHGLDDPAKAAKDVLPEDRNIILLRVIRETALPNQSELVHLRAEHTDRSITNYYRESDPPEPKTDVLTKSVMQQAAFRCRVLGTFVEDDNGILVFGKDVDAVYAAAGYVVAKPHGSSLQAIVDHVELPMGERPNEQHGDDAPNADLPDTDTSMKVGVLRYSSSRRREQISAKDGRQTEVDVKVRPKDFVAHKTAVFGMTRAGKSNTMKVIAAAVHLYSHRTGTRVGQLIFDPAGEYAYANRQDYTALSQLGDDVRIYRLGATAQDREKRIRPLSLNFFDASQIEGCWSLISTFLGDLKVQYVKSFLGSDPSRAPEDTDSMGDKRRIEAVRAMYFAALVKAGLWPAISWRFNLPVNQHTRALLDQSEELDTGVQGTVYLSLNSRQLLIACEIIARRASSIARATATARKKFTVDDVEAVRLWIADESIGGSGDPGVDGVVEMVSPAGSAGGWKQLRAMKPYHAANAKTDFAPSIYGDLARGRIVIVDLSRGGEQVLQTCAERVVTDILTRASQRFREGLPPRPMQIFLEEAHRLLHRDKFNQASQSSDPYVRLAKEAAKYQIGMIYATQEVSSVDDMILSNTANWVCAYMNNASETQRLAKYYDFGDFTEQILTADDRGFVRLRTDSSPYTLPVQVSKFDLKMVNDVRKMTGQAPTEPSYDFAPEHGDTDNYDDCPDPDEIYDDGRGARPSAQADESEA
ncbi:DUF87 domain-containing protein [Dactylosporangium sp. NPDC005555]|uniref:ATP-binding protein n=1 Tax=Dactylosporangium sp. NPDC005555 TaxID=3154889 RepID=UPI0033A86F47